MAAAIVSSDCEEEVSGRVSVAKLRDNWRMYEDGALAERLQSEEIQNHLGGNRRRNHQIRDDFPKALQEQNREQEMLMMQRQMERRKQRQTELMDQEMAKELQLKDSQDYIADRDRMFAKRLQSIELSNQPLVPQPRGTSRPPPLVPRQPPPPPTTPPLPVLNGDVPQEDDVLPHARQLSYNDEQYKVRVARPAVVTAEPVYANNKLGHYAVSDGEVQGAESLSGLLLGAAGLSQKDLALSKKAEEQLEMERRDAELARRLEMKDQTDQEQLELSDLQYALDLQEKEKAKLRRAKERQREKRRLQKLQQSQTEEEPPVARSDSRNSKRSQASGAGAVVVASMSPDVKPPARRPYVNTDAIDHHQSEFASADDEDSEAPKGDEVDSEPQYANVNQLPTQTVINLHQDHLGQVTKVKPSNYPNVDDSGQMIPPYMPMQKQSNKKSHSIEKRIKKKKEKEGCKQQ